MIFVRSLMPSFQWQLQPSVALPDWFVQAVRQSIRELSLGEFPGHYIASLLWQRNLREPAELAGFLSADRYQPASPFEFGQEMEWAVKRLHRALQNDEKVAIWGDFDADGITATAVLWEGLGQFLIPDQQLTYLIPNRLTESHGLSIVGLSQLADWGCSLIVTCDTGSTNLFEVEQANKLGIDVIITDHHTLPADRPPVVAIVNPRYLPPDHALSHLSGVAVAYKLVEALYQTLPDWPKRSLEELLDLVAIGLIADLVQLTGDCRYLAQRGIAQLQKNQAQKNQASCSPVRPGITRLLELCKRNGDRPTDISFGLGPRINAISRIHGDARFCVELLTSRVVDRCRILAEETELANTRRKALQKDIVHQVRARLAQIDLSTSHVIVLADPQWSVGILGLVAGQIAQEYGRPTILLSLEEEEHLQPPGYVTDSPLAKGSARSVGSIDLYQLVQQQAHLLHRFGGHPLAMGLSLPVENISLFTEAMNRQLCQQQSPSAQLFGTVIQADLKVTVAELGQELFRELKLLEPCGIGNPVPKLLVQNVWFTQVRNRNIQDYRGQKVRYIKTEFELWDDTTKVGFPGIWWDHYKDEIPIGRCDAIVELDFNPAKPRYEVRLLAVRPTQADSPIPSTAAIDWIVDWRFEEALPHFPISPFPHPPLKITHCPTTWGEFQSWLRQIQPGQQLALAYSSPPLCSPIEVWHQLVGIAKYLSRTGNAATPHQLQEKLGLGDRSLHLGLNALQYLGFEIHCSDAEFLITWHAVPLPDEIAVDQANLNQAIEQFLTVTQEEQFRRRYFSQVSLEVIQATAHQFLRRESGERT